VTDSEFANPGAVAGAPPDEERGRDERECDYYVERAAPGGQVRAGAGSEEKGYRDRELNERKRDEGQDATPAALFI